MKPMIWVVLALLALPLMAQESVVLVPVDGGSDVILVETADIEREQTPLADSDIVANEFNLQQDSLVTLNIEGRLSVFPMVIRGGVAAGVGFFNNRIEVGVDGAIATVLAGPSAEDFYEVGAYAKLRLIKGEKSTYYLRGRAFKVFSIGDQNADGLELGIGREFYSSEVGESFFELSLQKLVKDDGSTHYIPYFSMGVRFGKPLVSGRLTYLD